MGTITTTYYGPFDNLGTDRIYNANDFTQMLDCYTGTNVGIANMQCSSTSTTLTIIKMDVFINNHFVTIRNVDLDCSTVGTYYISAYVDETNREVLVDYGTSIPTGYIRIATISVTASNGRSMFVVTAAKGFNITSDSILTNSSQPSIAYTGMFWIPADTRS